MGQVETASTTVYLGRRPGEPSGEMHTLEERTFLTADKSAATTDPSEGAWLLGPAGSEIPVEDAVKYGLLDGYVPSVVDTLDARTISVDEIVKEQARLQSERERLEADKARFAEDRRLAAIAENHPDQPVEDATATSEGVTVDDLDAEHEALRQERAQLEEDKARFAAEQLAAQTAAAVGGATDVAPATTTADDGQGGSAGDADVKEDPAGDDKNTEKPADKAKSKPNTK